ncbi:hypothetical protein KPP03845_105604 [Streptomyces xanthophaeus]|uniref:HIT family protein n=1 Tax=Streptomyces xanthophaeus TaxID=67385 RepID=UPI00233EFB73|nr:HIT family protein [Streptomyces xanthophaeus]WCD89185.1 hypothetical protein KPP03845_105604 [Streptomyces xanthophaeus]
MLVPTLRARGVDAFHVGTSVRRDGWDSPVDRAAVLRWRRLIETDPSTAHRMAALLDAAFPSDGLTLFQADRPAGWQDVFHLHVHLVPRRESDHLHRPWTAERADPAALARTRRRILAAKGGAAPARHPGPVPPPVPVDPQ